MQAKNWQLLIIFVMSLGFTILYSFDPANSTGIYPSSLVRKFTGFYCPGCGATRAIHQLLHGNWLAALSLNCLLVGLVIYFIYYSIAYASATYFKITLPTIVINKYSASTIASIVILFGILRNIPEVPFSWLAP